jgi:hypothetical protein
MLLQVAGASVDPKLRATNGYDFGNNVHGDTYVFLLGEGVDGWTSSRVEFLQLAGATNASFAPFVYWKSAFYQDRLGTNVGKALKKRCVYRREDSTAP